MEAMLLEVHGLLVVSCDCAELLGLPIWSLKGIGEAIQKKTAQLRSWVPCRLCLLLHSHQWRR